MGRVRSILSSAGLTVCAVAVALGMAGCASAPKAPSAAASKSASASAPNRAEPADDTLFQYSTLSALMAGVYEGDFAAGALADEGDLGLGTLNALDGEMLMLDGQVYQVASDGRVREVADNELTPFAAVTRFQADETASADESLSFDELKSRIDELRGSENLPYAIRVDGVFASVKTRSVPAQTPPYRPLPEVLKEQVEFGFENVRGTLVGFWLPRYMNGANAGGYHLHFITAERDGGGHVLDCQAAGVTIALDETSEWTTLLPTKGSFTSTDLSEEQYQ